MLIVCFRFQCFWKKLRLGHTRQQELSWIVSYKSFISILESGTRFGFLLDMQDFDENYHFFKPEQPTA